MTSNYLGRSQGLAFSLLLLGVAPAWAAGFGTFDARAMALGGTSVALGDVYTGFYANPALLAFHDTSKNRGKFSRFYWPSLAASTTDVTLDAVDVADDELDVRLTDAIDQFNRVTSRESAAAALAVTEEIDRNIDTLGNQPLDADVFASMAVVVPSEYQGGAVYLGSRLVGGGKTQVAEADRALLTKYREFLQFASQNDTLVGAPHPELVDQTTGQIGNPANSITSFAVFRGALVTELGVAASGVISFDRVDLTLGITPKAVQALVFDEERRVVEESVAEASSSAKHLYVNADIGMSLQWQERVRLGIAVKDLKSKEFKTDRGNLVQLKPRPRLGGAYLGDRYSLGADLDLISSTPMADEPIQRNLSLGGEWRQGALAYRGGYVLDLGGERDGGVSLGLGFSVWRLVGDLAYQKTGEGQAVALQFGHRF